MTSKVKRGIQYSLQYRSLLQNIVSILEKCCVKLGHGKDRVVLIGRTVSLVVGRLRDPAEISNIEPSTTNVQQAGAADKETLFLVNIE